MYEIEYHPLVLNDDVPVLSSEMAARIEDAIETKLIKAPELFGKPLRQSLKGYRRLRVSGYRIIYRIQGKKVKIYFIQPEGAVVV